MKARKIGPYSRRHRLGNLDRRTFEAKLFESFRSELTIHVGGNPTITQRALIERASWLQLRCVMLDSKLADGQFTEHDSRTYLAWTAALARLLCRLGVEATKAEQSTLSEYLAGKVANGAAA